MENWSIETLEMKELHVSYLGQNSTGLLNELGAKLCYKNVYYSNGFVTETDWLDLRDFPTVTLSNNGVIINRAVEYTTDGIIKITVPSDDIVIEKVFLNINDLSSKYLNYEEGFSIKSNTLEVFLTSKKIVELEKDKVKPVFFTEKNFFTNTRRNSEKF